MFRLFRRIRKDLFLETQSSKFLLYALSEIFLVVLGILIALQINNWNEERIEQREISRFAQALVDDLEQDRVMAKLVIGDMESLVEQVDDLENYVAGKTVDQLDNDELAKRMRLMYYRPYAWNRSALEQISSAGGLRQIRNRDLAKKISAYEAYSRHLDQDFAHDRRNGNNVSALRQRVVEMRFERGSIRNLSDDHLRHLLTEDMVDIKIAMNGFQELVRGENNAGGVQSRLENELPKLLADIEELIKMLRAEYSD